MFKYLFFPVILCLSVTIVRAASHEDSAKAQAYWDSANHSSLYSQRRQQYLDKALAILPHYAWWWQQKSMPLYKQHKYQIGKPFVDSAVKYDPGTWLEYRGFVDCIFQKDYYTAIADFNEAKKIHSNGGVMDHSYDFYIGLSYLQLNRFDSAEYYINASIQRVREKLGDDWVNTTELFYAGIVQYEKENFDEAMVYFDKALRIYKNFSDAKYYKAGCQIQKKNMKGALALTIEANKDFKAGYSIVEDNAVYETYPYQINQKYYLDNMLKYLQTRVKD